MACPSDEEILAQLEQEAELLFTAASGGQLAWRVWGEGEPLVLFHGGHGSWKHWFRNIPVLRNRYKLYVPDLPGMGESHQVRAGAIDDIARQLANGLDSIGISHRYYLAAFSFGAQCAAYLHRLHAGRIIKACLLGSLGMGQFVPVNSKLRRWRGVEDRQERLAIHRFNLLCFMISDPKKATPAIVELHAQQVEVAARIEHARVRAADIADLFTEQPVPLTCIWGQEDVIVKDHFDERIAFLQDYKPQGRCHIIPNAGHWVMYEAADTVNQLLLEELRQDCMA